MKIFTLNYGLNWIFLYKRCFFHTSCSKKYKINNPKNHFNSQKLSSDTSVIVAKNCFLNRRGVKKFPETITKLLTREVF